MVLVGSLTAGVPAAASASADSKAPRAPTLSIQVGDAQIAYRDFGQGRPLVLLQRFRATMDDWDPALLDQLARNHRVILVDYAGAGSSSGTPRNSVDALAADVAAFISALGLGQADVLGWSLGGMVAQRVGLDHPGVVRCLVLASTHPGGGPGTAGPSAEIQQLLVKPGPRTEDELLTLFYAPTEAGRALGHASLIRIARRDPRGPGVGPEAVAALGQAVFGFVTGAVHPAYSELGSMRKPTLVAGGEYDAILPVANSKKLAELIPNAELVIYPDDAHAFLFVRHQDFSRRVDQFLGGGGCGSN